MIAPLLGLILALAAPAQAMEGEACLENRLPVPAAASFHALDSQEGSMPLGRRMEVAAGQRGCQRIRMATPDGRPLPQGEMAVLAPRPQGWMERICAAALRPGGRVTVTLEGSVAQPRCRFG